MSLQPEAERRLLERCIWAWRIEREVPVSTRINVERLASPEDSSREESPDDPIST
jgi:hypothetical protein